MNHFEEFRKEAEAACWRVTGKTVEEWDTIFARRRANGLRAGKLSPSRVMGEKEADAFMRYYGLSDGDLERVAIKPDTQLVDLPYSMNDLEVVVCQDSRQWHKFDQDHRHSYLGPMMPELRTVIGYRPAASLNNRRFE